MHGFDYLENAIKFESHSAVASFTHRFFRDDARIDVSFQVCYLLLNIDRVLHDLLLRLFRLNSDLEDLVDDFLQIFHHIVVLRFEVFVGRVDNADENFTIVLQGAPQSLQIVVHLYDKKERC